MDGHMASATSHLPKKALNTVDSYSMYVHREEGRELLLTNVPLIPPTSKLEPPIGMLPIHIK